MAVLDFISAQIDVYELFNVDSYLGSFGLVINPDYRSHGVAMEMLKARQPMMKELGLTVTVNGFSGNGSQSAAKRAGYEEVYSIRLVFKLISLTRLKFHEKLLIFPQNFH